MLTNTAINVLQNQHVQGFFGLIVIDHHTFRGAGIGGDVFHARTHQAGFSEFSQRAVENALFESYRIIFTSRRRGTLAAQRLILIINLIHATESNH
ncbi:hypothetical protein D3C80_1802700 [compost metagenome]